MSIIIVCIFSLYLNELFTYYLRYYSYFFLLKLYVLTVLRKIVHISKIKAYALKSVYSFCSINCPFGIIHDSFNFMFSNLVDPLLVMLVTQKTRSNTPNGSTCCFSFRLPTLVIQFIVYRIVYVFPNAFFYVHSTLIINCKNQI